MQQITIDPAKFLSTLLSAGLLGCLLLAFPASAQEDAQEQEASNESLDIAAPNLGDEDDDYGLALEVVEVTGKMGTKDLQDTPIAISVLGGEALAEQGVTNIQNLSESIPGLSLESGAGTGGAAAPFIRGVGQRDSNETLEGGVAIYVDDVYMGRPDGALLDLVDIANIQVLRGPQGTLFGKNATGGAMVITTNRPSEEFEANVMFRVGNLDRRDAQVTVNVPLIEDVLYSRLSVSTVTRDGYSQKKDPITLETIDTWDNEDRQLAYGRLRWLFSDYTTIDLAYQWGKQREKGRGGHCTFVGDQLVDANGNSLFRLPNGTPLGDPGLPLAIFFTTGQSYKDACQLSEDKLDDDEFFSGMEGRYENDINLLSATLDYELGDFAGVEEGRLKTVFAWRSVNTIQNQEIDGTAMPLIDREMSHERESDQVSAEFQFNFTTLDGLANGVAGFYFYHEETVNGQTDAKIGPFIMDEAVLEGGLLRQAWTDVGATTPFVSTYDTFWFTNRAQILDTETEMFAVFTQWIFDFSEEWSATVGLRYNWEEKGLQTEFLQHTLKSSSAGYTQTECLPNDPAVSSDCLPSNAALVNVLEGLNLEPFFFIEATAADLIPPATGFAYGEFGDIPAEAQLAVINNDITTETIAFPKGVKYESKTDTAFTPMLNITWNGNDAIWDALALDSGMAYLTYSKGFKSGGIVPIGIGELDDYDPEVVNNIEFGFKLELLERSLRINTALYYMDYDDIQVTIATSDRENPVDVQIALSNAGSATISGLENEITWMPAPNALIVLNTSYTDAVYNEFDYSLVSGLYNEFAIDRSSPSFVPCSDCPAAENPRIGSGSEPMPWVPRWTVYLALQYSFFHDKVGAFTPRFDASYKSSQSGHFDYYSYLTGEWEVPEYTIYNTSVTWDLPDNQTRIRAWVKNIEDTRYRNGGTPIPEILGGGTYSVSAPRTYGIDLNYAF